jgi:hypothetical protein
MLFGPDGLANFFLFLFLFGLIFTVVSLLLGFAQAGDLHLPHVGGHSHDMDLGGHDGHDGPGVFNLPTIMAFITWFGGIGYLLRQNLELSAFVVIPLAVLSGLVGGSIMFALLVRVLWPMMTPPLESKDFALPGTSARVVSSIRSGGVGEIVYTKAGARFTAGAKGVDDGPIAKGAEVVILRYEHGLAYVQGVDTLLSEDAPEALDEEKAVS